MTNPTVRLKIFIKYYQNYLEMYKRLYNIGYSNKAVTVKQLKNKKPMKDEIRKGVISLLLYTLILIVYTFVVKDNEIVFILLAWQAGYWKSHF